MMQHIIIIISNLFGDSSNEKSAVVDTHTDPEGTSLPNLVIIELFHALFCFAGGRKDDKRVASIQFAEVIHHQSYLVDHSDLLENRYEFVFETVPWNFSNKHF